MSVTDPPEQNEVGPLALIVAVGRALTVTVVPEEIFEHPLELVTLTLYVPEELTVIDCVV